LKRFEDLFKVLDAFKASQKDDETAREEKLALVNEK
jgi:hypothetical protein